MSFLIFFTLIFNLDNIFDSINWCLTYAQDDICRRTWTRSYYVAMQVLAVIQPVLICMSIILILYAISSEPEDEVKEFFEQSTQSQSDVSSAINVEDIQYFDDEEFNKLYESYVGTQSNSFLNPRISQNELKTIYKLSNIKQSFVNWESNE